MLSLVLVHVSVGSGQKLSTFLTVGALSSLISSQVILTKATYTMFVKFRGVQKVGVGMILSSGSDSYRYCDHAY